MKSDDVMILVKSLEENELVYRTFSRIVLPKLIQDRFYCIYVEFEKPKKIRIRNLESDIVIEISKRRIPGSIQELTDNLYIPLVNYSHSEKQIDFDAIPDDDYLFILEMILKSTRRYLSDFLVSLIVTFSERYRLEILDDFILSSKSFSVGENTHSKNSFHYLQSRDYKDLAAEYTSYVNSLNIANCSIVLKNNYIYFSDEVELVFFRNIAKLLTDLNQASTINPKKEVFFRGQAQSNYLLLSSIERKSLLRFERSLYEKLMIRCPDDFEHLESNIERLKKMQHYEMPTRLLDITKNLLVALYMVVENTTKLNNDEHDGELIVFETSDLKYNGSDTISILSSIPFLNFDQKQELSLVSLLTNEKILDESYISVRRLVHEINMEKPSFKFQIEVSDLLRPHFLLPTQNNKRIIRQDGAFIISPGNIYFTPNLNKFRVSGANGRKKIFICSKNAKSKLRDELELLGINWSTMYPEIDQVSKYLVKQIK